MSMTDRLVQRRVVSREDTSAVRGRGSGMLNTVCHNFAVSITVRRGGGGGGSEHTLVDLCVASVKGSVLNAHQYWPFCIIDSQQTDRFVFNALSTASVVFFFFFFF